MDTILQVLAEIEKSNETAALCIVTKSEGSTPRHTGSKMLVYPDGHFIGTVGGGDLEHRVIDEAKNALVDGEPRLLHYNMSDPARGDPGVCGGQVEVFVEPILPPHTIVVIGIGHVGKAVVHLAKWLGFHVVVSDDRPEFCNPETVPEADRYYSCPMSEIPNQLKLDHRTFLILTTRGSSVDVEGLPALLDSQAGYIGVIGSRRRWSTTVKELNNRGISPERIAFVHSPIGLELQAETPQEIAVSILAEIMMVKSKATGEKMKMQ
jgi:xanthine dehydrogenase accessory factor